MHAPVDYFLIGKILENNSTTCTLASLLHQHCTKHQLSLHPVVHFEEVRKVYAIDVRHLISSLPSDISAASTLTWDFRVVL